MKTMKKDVLLAVWMLIVAGLTIDYVATSAAKHPELIGIVLIIFFAFLGIMVGLGFILKKLDDRESTKQ
jgi:hypothetical protein